MNTKTTLSLTAIATIAITIGIYAILVSEFTTPISISLGVVCLCELVFIGSMGLIPFLHYKHGSTGIMIITFAILMLLWAVLYPSISYPNIESRVFYIGLLGISLLMLFLIGITSYGATRTEAENVMAESVITQKKTFSKDLNAMWLEIQNNLMSQEYAQTKNTIRILVERIQALPASHSSDGNILTGMRQISAMVRALLQSNEKSIVEKRICSKATELTNYIKSL